MVMIRMASEQLFHNIRSAYAGRARYNPDIFSRAVGEICSRIVSPPKVDKQERPDGGNRSRSWLLSSTIIPFCVLRLLGNDL